MGNSAHTKTCLSCGMTCNAAQLLFDELPPQALNCPKCDQDLHQQHNGRSLTCDIAHQHETVPRALTKLERLILEGWQGSWQHLRVIVGGRLIRTQVLGELVHHQRLGRIKKFHEDNPNHGAILITLR